MRYRFSFLRQNATGFYEPIKPVWIRPDLRLFHNVKERFRYLSTVNT